MGVRAEFALRPERILWDVVEEHLDEASYALKLWTRALESPTYTLDSFARSPEERLLAHVDGLVVGGESVARRLLEPQLSALSLPPDRAGAAALALLELGRETTVLEALLSGTPQVSAAIRRVCSAFGSARLDLDVSRRFVSGPSGPAVAAQRRAALLEVAVDRGLAVEGELDALGSEATRELVAAIVASRRSRTRSRPGPLEGLLRHDDVQVRDAAVVTGLIHGSQEATTRCFDLASDARVVHPEAILLVALVGEPRHMDLLRRHLTLPTHRCAALRAVGFSGQIRLVDAVLPYLDARDTRVARLAGEAMANLTGLDTAADPYVAASPPEPEGLPPLEEDNLDANLVPPEEEDLPIPNANAIRAFWRANGTSPAGPDRVLRGAPWTLTRALELLRDAPMRQRHPIALWLDIRSGGRARVDTRTRSRTQRAQLRAVEQMGDTLLNEGDRG